MFLNPDVTLIQDNTVEELYRFLSLSPKDVKIVGVNTHSSWDHGNKIPILLQRMGFSLCTSIKNIQEVARVQGSFFMMDKQLFDFLWGFDEKYFLYKEEEDLQLRVRLLGNKILYNPHVEVDHIWWVTTSHIRNKIKLKSDFYFIKKWLFFWKKSKDELFSSKKK